MLGFLEYQVFVSQIGRLPLGSRAHYRAAWALLCVKIYYRFKPTALHFRSSYPIIIFCEEQL